MPDYPVEIELAYSNGTPVISSQLTMPYYSDVSMTRTALQDCETLLQDFERHKHPRSDDEALKLAEYVALLRKQARIIEKRIKQDAEPFRRIIEQIKTATKII